MARKPTGQDRPPDLPPNTAIQLIRKQLERAGRIATLHYGDPQIAAWESTTESILARAFGSPGGELHKNTRDFKNARNMVFWADMPDALHQQNHVASTERQQALLLAFIEQLEIEEATRPTSGHPIGAQQRPSTNDRIRRLLERFHFAARQLRDRYGDRPTISIDDEYDVQDLLHALLRIDFDDVRREEPTQSLAGKSARMDFLLKAEEVVIETKMGRKGLTQKELGDELFADVQRYATHGDCKTLWCFVYDPAGHVGNPRGIERDLSRKHDRLDVFVIIRPE